MARAAENEAARKQNLLELVRTCANRDGGIPGICRFSQEAGVGRHVFQGALWPSWGAFLGEAGLAVGMMSQAVSDDDLLRHLAALTRKHGRFPTTAQLRFAHATNPEIPTEKTFRRRFRRLSEMLAGLRQWATANPNYSDVALLLSAGAGPASGRRTTPMPCEAERDGSSSLVQLSQSFVPPVVDCLPALAAADPGIERRCEELGLEPSVELERRTGIAFRILGLDVEDLGQGAGRVADGIARSSSGRWAIVFDAKVRRGGFVMGTEDRKFRDYLERHGNDLEREGIPSVYFAVISRSFEENDIGKAREVVRLTKAKAFVLLEAAALRGLVELKLSTHLLDDAAAIERLFAVSGVLAATDVDALKFKK